MNELSSTLPSKTISTCPTPLTIPLVLSTPPPTHALSSVLPSHGALALSVTVINLVILLLNSSAHWTPPTSVVQERLHPPSSLTVVLFSTRFPPWNAKMSSAAIIRAVASTFKTSMPSSSTLRNAMLSSSTPALNPHPLSFTPTHIPLQTLIPSLSRILQTNICTLA